MKYRESEPNEYILFETARDYLHRACAGLGSNGGAMLKIKFEYEPTVKIPPDDVAGLGVQVMKGEEK